MEVSIVVPVYNVEQYVVECIDSLLNQNFNRDLYEIIIVNDGSTDKSLELIMDNYEKVDNIRIVEKENGGLSSARNVGIKEARGKYIMFIDSDDIVAEDFLSKLYYEIKENDCDVVFSTYYWFYEEKNSKVLSLGMGIDNEIYNGTTICEYITENKNFKSEVCDDIYRLDFLKEFNITFEEGIIYEDEVFTTEVMYNLNKAKTLQYAGYYYRQRKNSITKSKNYDLTLKSIYEILNRFKNIYYSLDDENKKKFIFWRSIALLETLNRNLIECKKDANISKELNKYFLDNSTSLVESIKINLILNYGHAYNKIIKFIRRIRG